MPPYSTIPVNSPGRNIEQQSPLQTSSSDNRQTIVITTQKKCFYLKKKF